MSRHAVDTNVLVYAHLPGFDEHQTARRFLFAKLDRADTTLVVTPFILHEFLHIVTDPRRLEPPLAMAEAMALTRIYLERSNVECLPVTAEAMSEALGIMERLSLGRKRVADALLAGTLIANGVSSLITYNVDDFAGIPGLKVTMPS
jgi:predicted nucleic acid-binding protein